MNGCICGRCNNTIEHIPDDFVETTAEEFERVLAIQNWTRRNLSNGDYYSTTSFTPLLFAIRLLSSPPRYFIKQ